MIKVTVAKLVGAYEVLQKIANATLPARESWKALRILREIDKEMNTVMTARRELCEKLSLTDENGNFIPDENGNFIIKENKKNDFAKEMAEFFKEELEINCDKFGWEIIEKIDFAPAELLKIEDFIKEE